MVILTLGLLKLIVAIALFSSFTVGICKWKALKSSAKYTCEKISRSPNTSIIKTTFTSNTKTKCARGCAENRSNSWYYVTSTKTCYCNQGLDSSEDIATVANDVFYGEEKSFLEEFEEGYVRVYTSPPERDCLQYYQKGFVADGVYTIQPVGGVTVNTWCDMTNGGWTVFQRRQDGSENFNRKWDDYVAGFGDRCDEYWLGLDNIHLLTKEPSELHISLITFGNITPYPISAYASYSTFSIGDSSTKYKLTVAGFTGDCGDGLTTVHSGRMFSTFDSDNDLAGSSNCAEVYTGGWWYDSCHGSNLNGMYLRGQNTGSRPEGVVWYPCWYYQHSMKETVMKLRRL